MTVGLLATGSAMAISAEDAVELRTASTEALITFKKDTSGAENMLNNAKGFLVCPEITKGGFIVGVETGLCELQVGGETVDYYRLISAKFGWLAGLSWYSTILVFNEQGALDNFRTSDTKMEVGADLSVSIVEVGASGTVNTTNLRGPISGFIFSEKGLMADASLKGATLNKLELEVD